MKKASVDDSIALANEKKHGVAQMDSMQSDAAFNAQVNSIAANQMAQRAKDDSLALIVAARNLAKEKEMRSDAEKQLLSTGEILLDAVYFETEKAIITINSKSYLNVIAKMLLKYPKLQFEVAGHTDNIGDVDYNVNLSQSRADAVRIYLAEKGPALQLSSRGYGMSKPKADNGTKEGRQINRRVELHVTNVDALQEYNR